MPMVDAVLAEDINKALKKPPPASAQTKGLAKSIVNELKTVGLVSFLPGTVMGTAPPGGPLAAGSASNGVIAGPSAATLVVQMIANMGLAGATPQVLAMANAICTHIMTAGKVSFSPGGITGVCSNSATSPGALVGAGVGGTIAGLDGGAMAQLMGSAFGGTSPELIDECKAICDFIMKNASVSLTMGTVVGVCSAGGGPIAAGAGTGGKIT